MVIEHHPVLTHHSRTLKLYANNWRYTCISRLSCMLSMSKLLASFHYHPKKNVQIVHRPSGRMIQQTCPTCLYHRQHPSHRSSLLLHLLLMNYILEVFHHMSLPFRPLLSVEGFQGTLLRCTVHLMFLSQPQIKSNKFVFFSGTRQL